MRPIVNIKSKTFNITDKLIGAGSFSLVKVAYKKGDKTPIALKICHCNSESEWLQSLNEICLLKKLLHRNIVEMNHFEVTRFHVLIGLNKGEATLTQFIRKRSQEELRIYVIPIMSQIINALNFIHGFHIVHGDIKTNNILYIFHQDELLIQIMDFGLSHVVGKADDEVISNDEGGTKAYLAPERLFHLSYDETVDLFSAGIIFFELLFKNHPYYKEGQNYVNYMKTKPDPKFPNGYQSQVPKEWLSVLCSMLSYNPNNRNEVRSNDLLKTTYPHTIQADHQLIAIQNISEAESAEQNRKYAEAALLFMQASINIGIACHETENKNKDLVSELNQRIVLLKKKVLTLIHLFKHSYSDYDLNEPTIHDEYYDYLMEASASTPNVKQYLEIGYLGELYYREHKKDIAFKQFMDALQYLNRVMPSEPAGDRKTIIGRKMLQWTHMAEHLKSST